MLNAFMQSILAFNSQDLSQQILVSLIVIISFLVFITCIFILFVLFKRLENNRHDHHWQSLHRLWDEDILNALCGDISPAEFQKKVQSGQELDCVRFLMNYASRLRGSDLEMLSQIAKPYLPMVLKKIQHKDVGVRVWVISVVDQFGMPDYEKEVIKALDDKEVVVSVFAANCLLSHNCTHLINTVLMQFSRYGNWNLTGLTTVLAKIGQDVLPVLENIFVDPDWDMKTRVVCTGVMLRLNHYAIADTAMQILKTEQANELTVAILRLLAGIGHQEHCQPVRQLCHNSKELVRVEAMRCLRAIGSKDDIPVFVRGVDDSSPWVALQAAGALFDIGAVGVLKDMIKEHHPREVLAEQVLAERGA
ncbi:MAG: hypothetical protein ACI9MF_002344 [Gammaproteobacteria bacterium]